MEQVNTQEVNIPAKPIDQMRFEFLYKSVYKDMYKFAFYTLRSAYDAEDVVSEAVIDAFSSFNSLRDVNRFKAWIFKILSVKCKKRMKEYVYRNTVLNEMHSTGTNQIAADAELQAIFDHLSHEERLIISMSVFGGYTSLEIAKILKMNANTVRSKQSRALNKMKAELEQSESFTERRIRYE